MITDFKIFESIILENLINPEESYSAFINLKKYSKARNIYVHFTDLNKLGINPQKGHHDPYGIYFYPSNFIFGEDSSSMQYGYSMKYYYICQINTKNFLKINSINYSDIKNFFETSGLSDIFNKIDITQFGKRDDKKLWNILDMLNIEPSKRDTFFLKTAGLKISDYNINSYKSLPHITWNRFFNKLGYDGIIDNKGVVNENEPQQLIVFNPKTIKILDHGENKIQKNIYQIFFDELKIKLETDSFTGEYKTKKGNTIYLIKTKKENAYLNIEVNLSNNTVLIYYIQNDFLKTKKLKFNIFGERRELIINNIDYNYYSCFKDSDKNKKIEDYDDNNFMSLLNNIFNYIKPENVIYDENEIHYYSIDSKYLRLIYNKSKNNYSIEYYPFDNEIFFKFEFNDYNDFKTKLNKNIDEQKEPVKPKLLKEYLKKYSLLKKELFD